jgi:flagellar biosynthetic protein FlhB
MAENDDDGSKTEEPTERKLKKAKESGDVPISKEIGHMMIYGALMVFIGLYLPAHISKAAAGLGGIFDLAGIAEINGNREVLLEAGQAVSDSVFQAAKVGITALGILMVAAMLAGALQGPFVVSKKRIEPKLDKLSPMKGLKRLFGTNNLVEFCKSLVKLVALCILGGWVVYRVTQSLIAGTVVLPEKMPAMISHNAALMLGLILIFMVPVAMFDIIYKRLSHRKKQRMSHQDLKDENKDTNGDPQIKAKRQQIQYRRAKQRIQKSVPTATLVVTNPTHFAVALRYERGQDVAPVCVAKGTDLMAAQIRHLAYSNEIPVIESRLLARTLHATCEIDQVIPEAHWQEVAVLVGFVLDMRKKIRRKLPPNASLRTIEDEE